MSDGDLLRTTGLARAILYAWAYPWLLTDPD